jgi:hypothetical protein
MDQEVFVSKTFTLVVALVDRKYQVFSIHVAP